MARVTNAEIMKAIGGLQADVKHLIGREKTNEERIGAIERRVWWQTGLAAGLGVFLAKLGLPPLRGF